MSNTRTAALVAAMIVCFASAASAGQSSSAAAGNQHKNTQIAAPTFLDAKPASDAVVRGADQATIVASQDLLVGFQTWTVISGADHDSIVTVALGTNIKLQLKDYIPSGWTCAPATVTGGSVQRINGVLQATSPGDSTVHSVCYPVRRPGEMVQNIESSYDVTIRVK